MEGKTENRKKDRKNQQKSGKYFFFGSEISKI